MEQKGVVANKWNGFKLEELNTVGFTSAMNALESMPDKQEQSNLDL